MLRRVIEKTVFLLVLTLPLTYGMATVYIPYKQNPSMYNETKTQVFEYVERQEPVTLHAIAENNNLSNFQARYIASQLSLKGKLVECENGIRTDNCLSKPVELPPT